MMKKLDRNTYEEWMVDYFDGNLHANEIRTLMAFLQQNPDLKEEFESYDNTGLVAEKITYPEKSGLRKESITAFKSIDEESYEEWFVACHEGDLSSAQMEMVDSFVSINPHLENEFKLMGRLKITSDKSVVFDSKAGLKRKPKVAVYWWAASNTAAAAAILFLLFIFNSGDRSSTIPLRGLATIDGLQKRTVTLQLAGDRPIVLNKIEFYVEKLEPAIYPAYEEEELVAQILPISSRDSELNLIAYSGFAPGELTFQQEQNELLIAQAEDIPEQKERKGPLARIIKNFSGKLSGTKSANEPNDRKKEPTFVKILDQSITVFNTITGSDSELVKTYDKEGNLRRYQFEGESLSWSRDVASRGNRD